MGDAMSVTTTAGKVGKFETRFFHTVYETEFGCVKGHFGPINALAIHPNGRSYASGAEDGYIRLHFFDKSYLDMKDPVPEEDPAAVTATAPAAATTVTEKPTAAAAQ